MNEPSVQLLTQSARDPATRFRALAYVPGLERLGFRVQWSEIPPAGAERRKVLEASAEFDVTVVQRRLFNLRDQSRLRKSARALVFDFDDSIMFKDGGKQSLTRSGRFSRMVRSGDLILAGNEYLRAVARGFNRRVEVLPTVVDTERFRPASAPAPSGAGELVIGWIGSRSTVGYLAARAAELGAAAELLARDGVCARFEVVCDEFGDLPDRFGPAAVVRVPWSEECEVAALQRFDLGLMPLPDDPWTKGKCGFKLLQYLAVGIPAVADAVGVNEQILSPGEGGEEVGGVLARAPEEWVDGVAGLGGDADRRRIAGERGRERVVASYSLEWALPRMAQLLRDVAARRAVAEGPAS